MKKCKDPNGYQNIYIDKKAQLPHFKEMNHALCCGMYLFFSG